MAAPKKRDKDGNYWGEAEDKQLMLFLYSGSTRLEKHRAITKIYPKMRQMGRIILERYFSRYNDYDLIDDAISNFLLRVDYDPDKGRMYSYMGTSFRYYFHEKLVQKYESPKRIDVDTNYDIGDNEWLTSTVGHQPDFEQFDYSDRELLLNKIIAHIDGIISTIQAEKDKLKKKKKYHHEGVDLHGREIEFLMVSKDYFNKYFLTTEVSALSMGDYCRLNSAFPEHIAERLCRKHFNLSSAVRKYEQRHSINEEVKRGEVGYILDDYTPIENINQRFRNRDSVKKIYEEGGLTYF